MQLETRVDLERFPLPKPRRRRRWFQFGLRSLILGVVVSSIVLAWLGAQVQHALRIHNAARRLSASPGTTLIWMERTDIPLIDRVVTWSLGGDPDFRPVELRFASAPDADGPPDFDKYAEVLPMIESIAIESSRWRDDDLVVLKRFPQLKYLEFDTATISDDGFKHLACCRDTLIHVHVEDRPISDLGLEHLSALGNVESLSLKVGQLTPAGIQHFRAMSNLSSVSLEEVTDGFLESMPDLPNLHYLRMKSDGVTVAGIRRIAAMRSWTTWAVDRDVKSLYYADEAVVDLTGHCLTDDELSAIVATQAPNRLVVDAGAVTDDGVQALKSLKQLKLLTLRNCCISDIGLESLLRLPNLAQLDVSGCGVTATGFQKIDTCPTLHTILAHDMCLTPADELQIQRWSTNPHFSFNPPF